MIDPPFPPKLWVPEAPAIIRPAPDLIRPALGLTMLARTSFVRQRRPTAAVVGPITFVGSATQSASNGANITITLPGGTTTNDVVIVVHAYGSNTINSVSGYTIITQGNQASNIIAWAGYKVMGGSPDTSVTCNGDGSSTTAHVGIAMVFRGVDITNVIDTASPGMANSGGLGSANPDSPSITPTNNGSCIIAIAASDNVDLSVTVPTSYLPTGCIIDGLTETGTPVTVAGAYRILVGNAGVAQNPSVFNGWGSSHWVAGTIALRSA